MKNGFAVSAIAVAIVLIFASSEAVKVAKLTRYIVLVITTHFILQSNKVRIGSHLIRLCLTKSAFFCPFCSTQTLPILLR